MSAAENVLVLIPDATGAAGADPFRLADEQAPQVSVTDLAVTRGDGVFETVGVFDGVPAQMDEHLARLQRSARMLEIPDLDLALVRAAFDAAIEVHPDVPELLGRIMISRGPEAPASADGPVPWGWIHAKASPDYSRERSGIRVLLLDRGLPSTAPETSPWLLAGAKTLSYATNMAALREAERRGADDVLFVSSDGHALEGPTSTLLVRIGERFVTTPASAGVLPGTSLGAVAAHLREKGLEVDEELLSPRRVREADAAWLVSSGRLAAPITHLQDPGGEVTELAVDPEFSAELSRVIAGRPAR